MQTQKLLSVEVITDDETGAYGVGELDYSIPASLYAWLEEDAANRQRLSDWLFDLALRVDACEAPFDIRGQAKEPPGAVLLKVTIEDTATPTLRAAAEMFRKLEP